MVDRLAKENVSARYGVLTLAGPLSRELLQRITSDDVSRERLPFFAHQAFGVGRVPVRALRLSYVGELGFELHHPIEHQSTLYELLFEAGADLCLVDFGYRARGQWQDLGANESRTGHR